MNKLKDFMQKRHISILLCICLGIVACFISMPVLASSTSGGPDCTSLSGGSSVAGCDNCINSVMYQNIASGDAIITAMFNTINTVLANVEYSFFNGIVGATNFQNVIGTGILLYVTMYGIMIMFNITSYRLGEVANRLIKVAIVYTLTAPGAWGAFNTWVQTPVIGTMNQIIHEFTVVAQGGSAPTTLALYSGTDSSFTAVSSGTYASGNGLDPAAFSTMFGSSMTTIFSQQLFTAIGAMIKTGFFGWLISLFLFWALIEFMLMMMGALFTYAKAIIGLAFLFGIAPLFFIFLLFENTRQIFWAWLSHVITFALQPVLLFAFLTFYVALINDAVPYLFKDKAGNVTNYCWTNWFGMPGTLWQVFSWSPTSSGARVIGPWANISGGTLNEPINVPNAVYFLMLCHLAKAFTNYIEQLAQDIGEGVGPGVATAQAIEGQIMKGVDKLKSGAPKLVSKYRNQK